MKNRVGKHSSYRMTWVSVRSIQLRRGCSELTTVVGSAFAWRGTEKSALLLAMIPLGQSSSQDDWQRDRDVARVTHDVNYGVNAVSWNWQQGQTRYRQDGLMDLEDL
jgi:hypothetical protein